MLLAPALACALLSASPDGGTALKNPVSITADKLQVLNKQRQAIYTGHVVAVRGTTRIRCGRMVATYSQAQEITRIECTGGAEVEDGDRWARGDLAVYETATGVVEMTGAPEARQGPNTMSGDRVRFDLTKDTLEVEHPKATFEISSQARRSRGARDAGTSAPDAGAKAP
ncbi:MAG TPA: lipopolysaccharide transport periplasmic protein LptA [Myxococcaceae bacterium]|jgi:lipopolysaccharide export system protein LptA